jgi:hypothetical protein
MAVTVVAFAWTLDVLLNLTVKQSGPISVTAPSEAWFIAGSIAGIAGSNPAEGMDVCLLCLLYVV